VVSDIEHAQFEAGQFDCITMIAVFEHVKDPRLNLETVTHWLKPGGLLIIQVPYVQNFIRAKKVMPWLPVYFEAPRHLFDYSPKTLPRYFKNAGLEDVKVEISRPYSSAGAAGTALIWGVKLVGFLLYGLTVGRYVYPFAGGITVHGFKTGQ